MWGMGSYIYRRKTIKWTLATVSYTDETGKRIKEEKWKFNDVEAWDVFELRRILLKEFPEMKKPYVHKIIKTFYWEE